MQILLCDYLTPEGAAHEDIIRNLESAFAALKHETERVLIPFASSYCHTAEQMLAMRLMSVSDRADAILCLSSPAHLLPHPRKIIWLCGEPAVLKFNNASPEWMKNALTKGFREAQFTGIIDARRRQQLERVGIPMQHLTRPARSAEEGMAKEWKTLAKTLLNNVRGVSGK